MILLVAGWLSSTCADVDDNPYQSIIDRNPFGLKPAPTQDTNLNSAPVALSIKFTGISVLGESKRAYFMDSTKNPPIYYALSEGEQQESLKVVKIDEKGGTADIVNGGISTKVTFEKDGNKNVVAGIAPPIPTGMPGAPGAAIPGGIPGVPNANMNPPKGAVPMPMPNLPNNQAVPQNQTGLSSPVLPGAQATTDSLRMIPTRSLRTLPNAQANQAPGMSAEASSALMMINRELHRDAVERRELPPFPDPTANQ